MNSHQPLRSSSSPASAGMTMPAQPAPRPSSPNNTSTPARGFVDPSSSPRTSSPLNPNSQSPTPPSSNSLLPTPPPLGGSTRLLSFAGRDPSPVRDALIPISRAISAPSTVPQSSLPVAVSSSPPTPSIAFGSPSSATSSLFRSRASSPSRHYSPRTSPEREESTTTPASTWWSHKLHPPRPWNEPSKRKRTVPPEQAEAYAHTRSVRHLSKVLFLTFTYTTHALIASHRCRRRCPRYGSGHWARSSLCWHRSLAFCSDPWSGNCCAIFIENMGCS